MKILTWNTQWCRGLDGKVDPARIVSHARSMMDFDVLCLQEIADNYPGLGGSAGEDQPAAIAALLPGYEVFFGAAVDEWKEGKRSRFGNLIATRLPVHQVQHHPLPYPADPGVTSMPRMCTVVTAEAPGVGAVRVMTTHLEFYSKKQRMAQAAALRALHEEASGQASAPPGPGEDGSPFRARVHTPNAVLCGDFNLEDDEPEYAVLAAPGPGRWVDAWRDLRGEATRLPTFRLHDRTYGPEPVSCDFVFLSESLEGRVRTFAVDTGTKVSDHQPVGVELG